MKRWTLNAYFFRLYVVSFVSTLVVLFALVYLIDLIEVSRRGRFEDLSFLQAAAFSALRVPSFIEQAFPFIVLFSSISTLLLLNRRLELVVARAAGVSIWQILAPFVVGSLVIGAGATFAFNPISATMKAAAENIATDDSSVSQDHQSYRVPWLRQSADGVKSIIGAQDVSRGGTVLGKVSAYRAQ